MLAHAFSLKFIILYIYVISTAYTQFRGKVRLGFMRQIVNHSTLMAPVNALMYFFSAIPNTPYPDRKQFPELDVLRDNWKIIREEAQQLVTGGHIKVSLNNDDLGFNSFFKRGWKRFYLKWYKSFLPSAESLCPETVKLLQSVPSVHGAMFALLPAGGQLKPHRDPYAGSLRYHLGLVTPNSEKCRIFVDGMMYHWRDGDDVIFDETYIHAAKNDTDMDRIILFCDVERPLTNKIAQGINRFFARYVISEAATQNLATDRVGVFNKLYRYYFYVSHWFTRIKKFNKPLYQVLQYAGVAGLVYVIFF
jgi:beta-hydroxylase